MKTVVFSFGRMNPPTVGHEKLVAKIKSVARVNKAEPKLYISHTQDNKKNPLAYRRKSFWVGKAFGNVFQKTSSKTIIQVLQELEKKGFTEAILIVGADRVSEFQKLLDRFNGKDFNFPDGMTVVSAGDRDPDADNVSGMSASKMREFVKRDDFKSFRKGVPSKLTDRQAKDLFDELKEILG